MTVFSFHVVWLLAIASNLICCIEFETSPILVTKLAANEKIKYDYPASSKPSALVVCWNEYYGNMIQWDWIFGENRRVQTCPNLPCYFTADHRLLPLADAVLFHGYESTDPQKPYAENFPSYRRPDQRWIFITNEVPTTSNCTSFDGIFNWTMTYRRDSTVFMNYGRIILRPSETKKDGNKNYAEGKTKMAAWMSSHLYTASRREVYVTELQKHMNVDVYGTVGNLTCGSRFDLHACSEMISSKYKFYFSFENALCKDYITEKLTLMLAYTNVVPVTFGGADYNAFVPSHSYINALEFKSPKHLADYLNMLDKNDTLYNEYFNWKREQDVQLVNDFECDLCQKLLNRSLASSTIDKFHKWWIEGANCTSWQQ